MDLKTSKYHLHHHPLEEVRVRKDNPFYDTFPDPLCKLFPMAKSNVSVVEAPPTPGRPVFSFSVGSRKNFPSKWDDAQKWLVSSPDSPAHGFLKSPVNSQQQLQNHHHKTEVVVADEKKAISVIQLPTTTISMDHHGVSPSDSADVLLKDKFTNGEEDNYSRLKCVVPMKESFLFNSMKDASTEVVQEVKRCPTPYKNTSPPRYNTPASMSGPLALMNVSSSFGITELQECHLAKLQLENTSFDSVTCNWSSREEEEEDVSKSLRHFEMNNNECPKTIIPDPKYCVWEQEENTKSHLRYQREEAKVEAWVNLQKAKAEAQSRKLEVKIQKIRSKFEEKMMKKMDIVNRKAQELRATAQYEHNMQLRKATTIQSKKTKDLHETMHFSGSCGCFSCNNNLYP